MLCWLWTCGVKLTDKRNKTKVDVSFSHYTAAKKTTTGKVEDKDSINLRCSNGVHGASQSCFCPDVQISFFLLPCRHKSWNLVFICSYYMMAYRISLCFLSALRRLSNYTTTFPWAERVTLRTAAMVLLSKAQSCWNPIRSASLQMGTVRSWAGSPLKEEWVTISDHDPKWAGKIVAEPSHLRNKMLQTYSEYFLLFTSHSLVFRCYFHFQNRYILHIFL